MKNTLFVGNTKSMKVVITIDIIEGEVSIIGHYSDINDGEIVIAGQIYDRIREDFKNDKTVESICNIWERLHENQLGLKK